MKLIIDIPQGTYEAVRVGTINQVLEYKVWNAIKNGTPLDNNSERAEVQAEVQAYFDGEAIGWEEGRKALIDDIKAEIQKKYREVAFMDEFGSGYNYAVDEMLEILDNIGKEGEEYGKEIE